MITNDKQLHQAQADIQTIWRFLQAARETHLTLIAPGAIATPINQAVLDDPQAKANALSEIPWGRFGKPEEVAAVAVFLASQESEYVTGSTYYVDEGEDGGESRSSPPT